MKPTGSFSDSSRGNRGHAYTNTRVRVMSTKLLGKEEYAQLLKMQEVSEMLRFLEEREYGREITELAARLSGIRLLEFGLNRNLENTFGRILRFSVGASESQIRLYLKRWDVYNVQTLLRGIQAGESREDMLENMVFAGQLSRSFFEEILSHNPVLDQAKARLSGLDFCRGIQEIREQGKLDDHLEKEYFSIAIQSAEPGLREFFQKRAGYLNERSLFRARKEGVQETAGFLLPIPGKTRPGYLEEGKETEADLRRNYLRDCLRLLHLFDTSIKPVLGYFVAKETEIRNLRTIARAKHARIPEADIAAWVVN